MLSLESNKYGTNEVEHWKGNASKEAGAGWGVFRCKGERVKGR